MGYEELHIEEGLELESGQLLQPFTIAHHTYGTLNEAADNVIFVCHALTANSDVAEWWPGLFGQDNILDPDRYFIVCPNIIGSPYGTSSPRSTNGNGRPYGLSFPFFTTRDIVAAHKKLISELGIQQIHLLLGGSFGGHQALELAHDLGEQVCQLAILGCSAVETPWSVAIHEAQRLALEADPTFQSNDDEAGAKGLKAARGMALVHYRTYESFVAAQSEEEARLDDFKAASYIRYQGDKLVNRFHAHNYHYLLKALDTHNLGRGRASVESALGKIQARTVSMGIDTDKLIPASEQKFLSDHIPGAAFETIESRFGHDGFLIETEQIRYIIRKHLEL